MITYKIVPNKLDYQVRLDGKLVGHIRRGHWGWAYLPKGTKEIINPSFSLGVIKQRLEKE